MPDLKCQLFIYLKKNHSGHDRAITVRELQRALYPLQVSEREIRDTLRNLNMEGKPVLTATKGKLGVFIAESDSEIDEYLMNLGARAKAIHERMRALNRIKTREFLKGQMELFDDTRTRVEV